MPYDVAIVGGGLAGLASSLALSKQGLKVVLLEKETYPFHKVCGEYLSNESKDYLLSLGVPLEQLMPSHINQLQVSTPSGFTIHCPLKSGGFGLSRHLLDSTMALLATQQGVHIRDGHTVTRIEKTVDKYIAHADKGSFTARWMIGSWGKRSNLDKDLGRAFIQHKYIAKKNYVGVKYHIKLDFDPIALHNFNQGYCGISRIEGDRYCLCYLTTAANLQRSNQSISEMEQTILRQVPYLDAIWKNAEFVYSIPLAISQIHFGDKEKTVLDFPLCGDAAGSITPLTGNGMSMALHSSKLISNFILSIDK